MAQQNQACAQPSGRAGHVGPDPDGHARALVEWYGARMALEMARFYAKDGPAGAYWSDVLASLTERFPQPK
jgi:hypothetical protein